MSAPTIDNIRFRRILTRNLALPLAMSVLGAAVFIGIIAYLVNVLSWVEHSERVIGQANEVSRLTADMEASMRGYLLSGDEAFLSPYLLARQRIDTELQVLGRLVADNEAQAERVRHVGNAQETWEQYASEMISRRRNGVDYVEAIKSGRGQVLTDEMRRQFGDFLRAESRLRQERSDAARSFTSWSVASFLLLSLLAGGAIALFGRRELLRLSQSYQEVLDHESEHNNELRHQAWLRGGQTERAARSAGIHALEPLAQAMLAHLTRYLNGAVSAMYVRSDEGVLTRIGTYGFAHEEGEHARVIQPAESLASQAATENRKLVLKELPADYIKVSSALGAAPPRELLIAPFSNYGKVKGVIEIGFLHSVRERDLEFMDVVNASIGAAVAAVLIGSAFSMRWRKLRR